MQHGHFFKRRDDKSSSAKIDAKKYDNAQKLKFLKIFFRVFHKITKKVTDKPSRA